MKKRWNYIVWFFLLMLGLFTGCGKQPPETPGQDFIQEEYLGESSAGAAAEQKDKITNVPQGDPAGDSSGYTDHQGKPEAGITEAPESSSGGNGTDDFKESGDDTSVDDSSADVQDIPDITAAPEDGGTDIPDEPAARVQEDGEYTSKEEVAAYLYKFGHLPDNYITKAEARELGWVSQEGNLYEAAPGKSIGGDYFGNYEGILPEESGRQYHECDIDTDGSYRGAKRIVYSNDGLIYYTEDHYNTFELLYTQDGPAED